MAERKVLVVLNEMHVQEVTRAVVDRDRDAALALLDTVIKPQMDAALSKGHCRPAFEMKQGTDLSTLRPPPRENGGKQ